MRGVKPVAAGDEFGDFDGGKNEPIYVHWGLCFSELRVGGRVGSRVGEKGGFFESVAARGFAFGLGRALSSARVAVERAVATLLIKREQLEVFGFAWRRCGRR